MAAPGALAAADLAVRIGHVAPTSGWPDGVGIESENGARMAIEHLNARGITVGGRRVAFALVAADDAGDEATARMAAARLVAAKVSGVVGHLTSGPTIAAAPVYANAGIPQISPSATSPAYTRLGLSTTFRLIADDTHVARALANHAVAEMKAQRVLVIDDRSRYGRGLAEEFSKIVVAAGGHVVESLHTNGRMTDFSALLSVVKDRNPDAIFFGGFDREAGLMIKQMKDLGIGATFLAGDGACTPDLVSYWSGGAASDDQVVCATPAGVPGVGTPPVARFALDYAKRFEVEPEFFAPYAYDAVMVMVDAMVRAGSTEPAKYLPALAATRDYRGVTGVISFDDKGDVREPALGLFTYRDEERLLIRIVR
ncbi:MAG TPA: branched-chain amino acid ABC transporter substrate-binding protein [Albitalea sp.]|nr:branched-chain amino acid ABC transporter substrate-binding protein [Albitalea sp.]